MCAFLNFGSLWRTLLLFYLCLEKLYIPSVLDLMHHIFTLGIYGLGFFKDSCVSISSVLVSLSASQKPMQMDSCAVP